jgi:hypothetical protein
MVGPVAASGAEHRDGYSPGVSYEDGDRWDHSPSAAQIHAVTADPETSGGVLVGTDTGEVWRVRPDARWTRVVQGLPMVQSILPLA